MARLEALGYRDPAGALRHIEALTSGLRRRAAIQRTLLPVLLGWFADAAEPDAGLLAFRQVSEALGESPWFLRLLRDETKAAERMASVLASSRYATGLLLRAPEAVALFADDAELVPKPVDALRAEMMAAARRHDGDAEQAAVAVRSLRRRELFRVAAADVLGLIDLAQTGEALTAITTASLDAVLAATIAKVETELARPAADQVRGDRDGPLRRARVRLRQRRRRHLRARPAARFDGRGGRAARLRRGAGGRHRAAPAAADPGA